ncbi:MAG: glycosyl hydrolase family 28-related protein [Armatimonadota bacterium]
MKSLIYAAIACFSICMFQTAGEAKTWDVVEAGAVGDGIKDNTAIFQQLLDEAGKEGGGIVNVPSGHFRIDGNLVIPGGVTLQGTFRVPPTDRHDKSPRLNGTVLLAFAGRGKPNDPPFIRLGASMATLAGVIITYPEWKQTDVPPVPYPPCILSESCDNVGVLDCCLINPYEGIKFVGVGRFLVRNVYGYPIKRGLYVDKCFDIGRVENVHYWPFGLNYDPKEPYCKWINTNGVAFEFAQTDWQYVLNTFCFGYGVGYKFSPSPENPNAGCNGNFVGLGADCCQRAILVEQGQAPGLLITNGEFVGRWTSDDSVQIEVGPNANTKVSLSNCSFWGPSFKCIWQKSPKSQVTATGCNFLTWDSSAIQVDAGKVIIQGNTFAQDKLAVTVGSDVQSAIIMGNQAANGLKVKNRAGDKTEMIGNEKPATK